MRVFARLLSVFALVGFPIGGCTEVTTPTTAPLTLYVYSRPAPGEERVALEDVRMCETGTTNCEWSDAGGIVTIELPHGEEYSYTLEKDGYASYHTADIVIDGPDGYDYWFLMESDERMALNHQSAMSDYPMRDTGTILISIGPTFAGATFELVGATSKPFYNDEDGNWSLGLTATTRVGTGGFVGVSSGDFKIRISGSAQDCVTSQPVGFGLGWLGDEPNSITVPVQAGYINQATVSCPRPPGLVDLAISVWDGEEAGQPVPGARVCELDSTTNCEVTDPNGRVTIQIPFEVESGYTVEKEGYASDLYPNIIPLNGSTNGRRLRTNAFMAAQHDRVDSPYPMRLTGSIFIGTFGIPGVTFELVEAIGTAFYRDEEGWNPDLTETTSGGGGFTEVSPGEFLISLGGNASGCTAGLAWPTDDENTIKLPVREGFVTRANIFGCPTPP